MQKKTNKAKKTFIVVAVLAALVVAYISYEIFKPRIWYTQYQGPDVKMPVKGEMFDVPVRTWTMLKASLREMQGDHALARDSLAVHSKLPEYLNVLVNNLGDTVGMNIDFISMIHPSSNGSEDFAVAVRQSQISVQRILARVNYDIVGVEGSWSDPLTKVALVDENIYGMKRHSLPDVDRSVVALLIESDRSTNGALAFQDSHPEARLIGIEDRELYFLHDTVSDLMKNRTGSLAQRDSYRTYDRILVWQRTELSLAKLISAMKAKKLKKGALIMGQNHRHQFEVMGRILHLNGGIHQTVPEKYRNDEAG